MSDKRQKTQQLQLAFMSEGRSEAPTADVRGTESPAAKRPTESPAGTETLMEVVCSRENPWKALKRVQANDATPKESANAWSAAYNQTDGISSRSGRQPGVLHVSLPPLHLGREGRESRNRGYDSVCRQAMCFRPSSRRYASSRTSPR